MLITKTEININIYILKKFFLFYKNKNVFKKKKSAFIMKKYILTAQDWFACYLLFSLTGT